MNTVMRRVLGRFSFNRAAICLTFLGFFCFVLPAQAQLTLTVNSAADPGNGVCDAAECTLREALAATAAAGNDTINFSAALNNQTITLTSGELLINNQNGDITINGPGANLLAVSGNNLNRVLGITNRGNGVYTVTINGLTIRDGNSPNGSLGNSGGGIKTLVGGNLALNGVVLTNNRSSVENVGAAIDFDASGRLTINNSTISNNFQTSTGALGAIEVNLNLVGTLPNAGIVMNNSTVSGNTNLGNLTGGIGIVIGNNGQNPPFTDAVVSITNSTITNNQFQRTTSPGGAVGLTLSSTVSNLAVTLRNNIIAGNIVGSSGTPDVDIFTAGGFTATPSYNLIGDVGTNGADFPAASQNQTGTAAAPLNPLLAPLASNGGTTPTHMPQVGSPAIDKGNSAGLTTDQRGFARPYDNPLIANAAGGNGSDIGAFEVQPASAASVFVTGRVSVRNGKGLRNARVVLTDSAGNTKTAVTGMFGYFRFDDVTAGEAYTVTVASKQYSFEPQVVNVMDDVTELDFVALGR